MISSTLQVWSNRSTEIHRDSKYFSKLAGRAASVGCCWRIGRVEEEGKQAQRGAQAGFWDLNCEYSSHFPDHRNLNHSNRISDISGTQIHTFESRSTGGLSWVLFNNGHSHAYLLESLSCTCLKGSSKRCSVFFAVITLQGYTQCPRLTQVLIWVNVRELLFSAQIVITRKWEEIHSSLSVLC